MTSLAKWLRRCVTHGTSLALVAVAIPIFTIVGLCVAIVVRYRKLSGLAKPTAILHCSVGSSVESVLTKFGSMRILFDYDGRIEEELFDRTLLYWYPTKNSLRIEFPNGWIVNETREFGLPLYRLGLMWNLTKVVLAGLHYDVRLVRAWDPYFCGMAGLIAKGCFGVPLCVSIHADYDKLYRLDGTKGAPEVLRSRALARMLARYVLRKADRVLAITEYIRIYAEANGARPEAQRMFRHIVDLSAFEKPASRSAIDFLHLPRGRPVISAVCRLSKQKLIYDIITLGKILRDRERDFVIVVAGGGPEEAELRRRIEAEGLENRILLPGFLSSEQVVALRQNSTINLCLLDGRSLIEACAAGRPVLAYDTEWHSEIVVDGKTGFLVPEGDTTRLADRAVELLGDPAEATRLGDNAKRYVFETFDKTTLLDNRRAVYSELLSGVDLSGTVAG